MKREFRNDATNEEKADQLRNEKLRAGEREPTTLHQLASVDVELGGRFARPDYITGTEAASQYPRLPTSSPWSSDPVPPEQSLGFQIGAMEPVGTFAEVAASIPEQSAGQLSPAVTAALSDAPVDSAAVHERLHQLFREGIRRKL
jgi:hypothetical protein